MSREEVSAVAHALEIELAPLGEPQAGAVAPSHVGVARVQLRLELLHQRRRVERDELLAQDGAHRGHVGVLAGD